MGKTNLLMVQHRPIKSERIILLPISHDDAEDILNIHLMKKRHVTFTTNIKIWTRLRTS